MIYLGWTIGNGEVFITMEQQGVIKKCTRPAFMEPLPSFKSSSAEKRIMKRSSFPLKDDAGYIGYLSDDDEGSVMNEVVNRRRRELLGTDGDMSFSGCLLLFIIVVGLVIWGVGRPY
jgi:hypothetical protein